MWDMCYLSMQLLNEFLWIISPEYFSADHLKSKGRDSLTSIARIFLKRSPVPH